MVKFVFVFFSFLLFVAPGVMGEEDLQKARNGEHPLWPKHDKVFVAVFNRAEDQFEPLIDDGQRIAKVAPKDRKVVTRKQLEALRPLVTGKHAATEAIDFYRPTAGVWFENDGKITGFLEFSFESFSRRTDVKGVSQELDWRGLAKWFEAAGLSTNFDADLFKRMLRK